MISDKILSKPICGVVIPKGIGSRVLALDWVCKHQSNKGSLVIDDLALVKDTWIDILDTYPKNIYMRILSGKFSATAKWFDDDEDLYITNTTRLTEVAKLFTPDNIPFDKVVIMQGSSFKHYGTKKLKALIRILRKLGVQKRLIINPNLEPANLWPFFMMMGDAGSYQEFTRSFLVRNHFNGYGLKPGSASHLKQIVEQLINKL